MRNKRNLVDELTLITNLLVKYRDNWYCQLSGQTVSPLNAEVHHIFTKKAYPNLRFDLQNLILLSNESHVWFHKNQMKGLEWFKIKYPERYEYLLEKKDKIERMYKYYSLENLLKQRLEIIKNLGIQ